MNNDWVNIKLTGLAGGVHCYRVYGACVLDSYEVAVV